MFRLTDGESQRSLRMKIAFNWYTFLGDCYLAALYIANVVNFADLMHGCQSASGYPTCRACYEPFFDGDKYVNATPQHIADCTQAPTCTSYCQEFALSSVVIGLGSVVLALLVYGVTLRLPPHPSVLGLKIPIVLLMLAALLLAWAVNGSSLSLTSEFAIGIAHLLLKTVTLLSRLVYSFHVDVMQRHCSMWAPLVYLHAFVFVLLMACTLASGPVALMAAFFPVIAGLSPLLIADLFRGFSRVSEPLPVLKSYYLCVLYGVKYDFSALWRELGPCLRVYCVLVSPVVLAYAATYALPGLVWLVFACTFAPLCFPVDLLRLSCASEPRKCHRASTAYVSFLNAMYHWMIKGTSADSDDDDVLDQPRIGFGNDKNDAVANAL